MRKLRVVGLAVLVLAMVATAEAQIYTDLFNMGTFAGDTIEPAWSGQFAQARDGNLYSTSQAGGTNGIGTVFRLTPDGNETVLHSFAVGEGRPYGGLTLGLDGFLYGVTIAGGSLGYGSIYKISTDGTTFTVVHSINGSTEGTPWYGNTAPIVGADGNFYGSVSDGNSNYGTIYKMTAAGSMKVLFAFDGTVRYPYGIVQGSDGNFYGTAGASTGNQYGIVFRITAAGKFTILHTFAGYPNDGAQPYGSIIQAADGNFYGTTKAGGLNDRGTIYKMTLKGVVTIIHSFSSSDGFGYFPFAGVIQATDGKLYGATTSPGGILFQGTSSGGYSVMVKLTGTTGLYPGSNPQIPMFQHTNGTLYGDTVYGGSGNVNCGTSGNCGVLYSLDMGLNPFVALMTTAGKAGKVIQILGNGLTGTTSVMFGSGSATFHVVSDTYMTATVPATGTTGSVIVTAPSGARVSSKSFKVQPAISGFTPSSGAVGSQVVITGTGLTQTSAVSFGAVKASSFTVNSATQVTATVPTGAVTGKIKITTPGGSATSTAVFTVM